MSDARACLHFGPPGPNFCPATFCHPVAEEHALFVEWWRAVSPLGIRSAQVGLLASGKAGGVCLHVLLGMGHMHQRWLGHSGFTVHLYDRVSQLGSWTL